LKNLGCVIANRTDGAGERLKAIVNAIFISEMMDLDFKFTWLERMGGGNKFHATECKESIFSKEFIDDYHIEKRTEPKSDLGMGLFKNFDGDLALIANRLANNNLIMDQRDMSSLFPSLAPINLFSSFQKIGFSENIQSVKESALNFKPPKNSIAIHMRSGDIIHGPHRHTCRHTQKVITVPVALELIKRAKSKGYNVVLFGQNLAELKLVKETSSVNTIHELYDFGSLSSFAQVMAEFMLLTKFDLLIAGNSGFAHLPARISSLKVIPPKDWLNRDEYLACALEFASSELAAKVPRQSCYALMTSYYELAAFTPANQAIEILNKANSIDVENQGVNFLLAINHSIILDVERAEYYMDLWLVNSIDNRTGKINAFSGRLVEGAYGERFDGRSFVDALAPLILSNNLGVLSCMEHLNIK
jgi:hypothetical protein